MISVACALSMSPVHAAQISERAIDDVDEAGSDARPSASIGGYVAAQGIYSVKRARERGFQLHDAAVYLRFGYGAHYGYVDVPFSADFDAVEGADFAIGLDKAQAYVGGEYDIGFSWMLGQFDSIVGYEDNDSPGNPFNQPSKFFNSATPNTHAGIWLGYSRSDVLSFALMCANPGEEGLLRGGSPEFGAVVEWNAGPVAGYVSGLTKRSDGKQDAFIDVVTEGTLLANSIAWVLEGDLTKVGRAADWGFALLGQVVVTPVQLSSAAIRVDYVSNQDVFEGLGVSAGLQLHLSEFARLRFDYLFSRQRENDGDPYADDHQFVLGAVFEFR